MIAPARKQRVLVAMSGGVDSSVAAALLAGEGYEVVGVTMKNFCYSHLAHEAATSSCCSLEAIDDARRVADRVGFAHYVLDFEEPFGRAVIDDFVNEYAAGRTPNPCVRCNRLVRFPHLYARARALGADWLATGHYAQVDLAAAGSPRLLRGADREKDQSYYLWGLTEKVLARTLFPVGHLTKSSVRELAAELDLEVADKPESMEVCFIPDGDLRGFLQREAASRRLAPEALARFEPGPLVSTSGDLMGEHPGSAFFTVGQRRGLGAAFGEPRYVIELRDDNTVAVGGREELGVPGCLLEEVNWMAGDAPALRFTAEVQVRHHQPPVAACVTAHPNGGVRLDFAVPVQAVAPGQSAVLYDGNVVLGGGVIRETG